MALFQGLFFLVMGVLLLGVAYQSISRGWLPFGSNGLMGRLEIQKEENPLGYWAAFCLYALGGLAITVYAILILTGLSQPLPMQGRH